MNRIQILEGRNISPDIIGEYYREQIFPEQIMLGKYGCYSTFEVHTSFGLSNDPKLISQLIEVFDIEEEEKNKIHLYISQDLLVAWYWDGDGSLFIQDNKGHAVLNDDCKKSSGWQYIDPIVR